MTSIWFVTPAYQRFDVVAICLEQRRRVIAALAGAEIEGRCVVVADDENLDIARGLGFDVVEQNNDWLGRRFNDGKEYAGRHGADWIVPIGSDDWIDPFYLMPLPTVGRTRTSHYYAPVEPTRLAELWVESIGAGPRMYHRRLLEPVGFRPSADEINRNTDHNAWLGMPRVPHLEWRDLHPLQYVGFRAPPFVTQYARLWRRWGKVERDDPWEQLATRYDRDLVDPMRKLMTAEVAA